ncbi:hypothetical protein RJ640_005436 [Escallonia rubra]|uniref:Pentatricopeptide repeat-containing protein n=1 Tax=Escallonia rubra TaxID=112253 RepID=A0AA88QCF5_9ASTE|nr:hypothetical protein RJ640_005436 [Escallonia rubra]
MNMGFNLPQTTMLCAVNLFDQAGQLTEAYQLVNEVPHNLLGACRVHQNVELGEIAANNLLRLEPNLASHYIPLANIYPSAGLWEKAVEVRENMMRKEVRKEPGCSWIEFGDGVHRFTAGDESLPHGEQLLNFLEILLEKLKKEGYVHETCVLRAILMRRKRKTLCVVTARD